MLGASAVCGGELCPGRLHDCGAAFALVSVEDSERARRISYLRDPLQNRRAAAAWPPQSSCVPRHVAELDVRRGFDPLRSAK